MLACIAAGKPVLCEKPLATTAEASLHVVDAEAAAGRRLVQVGFMRRFDPGYGRQARARRGRASATRCSSTARTATRSCPPAYTSEMLVTSSCAHEIDMIRWLPGEEIVAVTLRAPRSTERGPERAPRPAARCSSRPRAAC